MKKILVTGGFGKIGQYFIKNFEREYKITVADLITNDGVFTKNVKIVKADLTDYSVCENICSGIDTVVHLAGIADPHAKFEEILSANIIATKNI